MLLAALATGVAATAPGRSVTDAASAAEVSVWTIAGIVGFLALAWFTSQLFLQDGRLLARVEALEARERERDEYELIGAHDYLDRTADLPFETAAR
jgi:hypothetical protein